MSSKFTAWVLVVTLLPGCTTAPLLSKKGVSTKALSELGVETLLAAATMGAAMGHSSMSEPEHFSNFESSDKVYLGGVIPMKHGEPGSERSDNGTRLWVDGHDRGFLPRVIALKGPGPHRARISVPAFLPQDVPLQHPISLECAGTSIEAWPPIIVDCLTGEIFTTTRANGVDHDRNSGLARKTELKVSRHAPILIATTTDRRQPAWTKIGQMRSKWSAGAQPRE
jgi:hypothetical protein